jgi:hypothetical protein
MLWEDALRSLASSAQGDVEGRDKVAGAGSPAWIKDFHFDFLTSDPGVPAYGMYVVQSYHEKLTSEYWFDRWIVLGADFDSGAISDGSSPFSLFDNQGSDIVNPLNGWQNDTTSVFSFDQAVNMLKGIDPWLVEQAQKINGWATAIGDTGSDWQGSAAATFKATLSAFAGEVATLQSELNTPDNRWNTLQQARDQLMNTVWSLEGAIHDWRDAAQRLDQPINCLKKALKDATDGQTAKITYGTRAGIQYSFTIPGYGDASTQGFWTAIENKAKQIWLDHVGSTLDAAATPAMARLAAAYQSAIEAMGTIAPIQLKMPPPPTTMNTTTNGNDTNLNTLLDNLFGGKNTNGGPGSDLHLGGNTTGGTGGPNNAGPHDLHLGGSTFGGTTSGSGPGGPGGAILGGGPGGIFGGTTTGGVLGSNGSGGDTVLGPNGKPVTDPATGAPLLVPPGTTISAGGQLIGPDGRPILGGDGKPVTVTKGSTIAALGGPPANVVVPRGSKLNADATVTGPDGKPVLDPNGNPLILPKGSTISADGAVLGPNGKPIPLDTQLLTDQEHAMAGPPLSLSGPPLNLFGGPPASLLGGLPPSPQLGSVVPTVGGAGAAELVGVRSGLSQKALDNGGVLTPEELATQNAYLASGSTPNALTAPPTSGPGSLTAEGAASALGGEGLPMMPMGMGAAGAGQGGNQERQRTTWLAEDEEVWGTETGAVSGTIGR